MNLKYGAIKKSYLQYTHLYSNVFIKHKLNECGDDSGDFQTHSISFVVIQALQFFFPVAIISFGLSLPLWLLLLFLLML